jgi:hypothetical protein
MVKESISPCPAMTTLQERDLLDYIKELRQHGQDGAAELLASLLDTQRPVRREPAPVQSAKRL